MQPNLEHQPPLSDRVALALGQARRLLLEEQTPAGHWEGELSSSALSTATAVTALALAARTSNRSDYAELISAGLAWLAQHANPDGGWGDTIRSLSNLSTTALCWAAFGAVPEADSIHQSTVRASAEWLARQAGGTDPSQLAPAIIKRYGKDRTFSAPILTMCALSGRFGQHAEAWSSVIPLPFELAAFPQKWFSALRLPVVSYALPALIAIGQVRHIRSPSRNPLARLIRTLARPRTLDVLKKIQPVNGGFLEATPLTSFVVMSLAGAGQAEHPVTRNGIEFLRASIRRDGSWPIDTNLSTWVTTLSVNALSGDRGDCGTDDVLPPGAAEAVRSWLLRQQYDHPHPYTGAAPGGWAWTDLPGGVPDADDTAGALLALRKLGPVEPKTLTAVRGGINWLLDLQNRDGGIPTFCRGWGALPFDRSSPDLTAHAIRAWLAWESDLPGRLRERLLRAVRRGVAFLLRSQRADGAWAPLWFGNQFAPDDENPTYGTASVVRALSGGAADEGAGLPQDPRLARALGRALDWLLEAQHSNGSWGGFAGGPASTEETALAVEAVAEFERAALHPNERARTAIRRGADWLVRQVETGAWREPAPIGFYFARLWYYERLYPCIFTVGALRAAAPLLE